LVELRCDNFRDITRPNKRGKTCAHGSKTSQEAAPHPLLLPACLSVTKPLDRRDVLFNIFEGAGFEYVARLEKTVELIATLKLERPRHVILIEAAGAKGLQYRFRVNSSASVIGGSRESAPLDGRASLAMTS
jgi:hypothetical protein